MNAKNAHLVNSGIRRHYRAYHRIQLDCLLGVSSGDSWLLTTNGSGLDETNYHPHNLMLGEVIFSGEE